MVDTPSTKVTAGVLAGAVVAILVWLVQEFTDIDPPAAVAAALVVIVSFLLSYFIRETNPAPSAVAEVESRHAEASAEVPYQRDPETPLR